MVISVRTSGWELSPVDRLEVIRRFDGALARFPRRVQRVALYLSDANGTKGGVDKLLRCVVHLRRQRPIVIEDRDANPRLLIDRVAHRAQDNLGRLVARLRSRSGATSMAGDPEPESDD